MYMYYDTVQHITTIDTTYIHVSGFIKWIKYQGLNVQETYCCIPFRVLYNFLSTTYIINSEYFKEISLTALVNSSGEGLLKLSGIHVLILSLLLGLCGYLKVFQLCEVIDLA